ncbi:MAG: thermonuclease family protein [Gammaproteobacteria bacterium]|nr:thermonuclease family protein [Gammaproteobacteria bacterium]
MSESEPTDIPEGPTESGSGQISPLSIQAAALVRSIESLSSVFWIGFGGTFLSMLFAGLSQLEVNAATDYIYLGEYQVPKSILPLISVGFAGFTFWLTGNRMTMLSRALQRSHLPQSTVHEIFRLNPPVLNIFDADNAKPWKPTTGINVLIINWSIFFGNSLALTWSSALQQGAAFGDFDLPLLALYLALTILVLAYARQAIGPPLAATHRTLHGIGLRVAWPRYLVAGAMVSAVFIINHWEQLDAPVEQADDLLGPAEGNAIDGETLLLRGVEVQLFGMDAVEVDQICQDAEGADYPCGRRATYALQTLLRTGAVVCFPLFTVNENRVVAVCELVEDGAEIPSSPIDFLQDERRRNLSRLMIAQGHALSIGIGSQYFGSDQDEAQRQRIGIWQGSFQPPSAWRRR